MNIYDRFVISFTFSWQVNQISYADDDDEFI